MQNYQNNQNQDTGYELDWDSTIEKDQPDFVLLPKGEYGFKVTQYERGRYNPNSPQSKLPPCNMATVYIKVDAPAGVNPDAVPVIKHRLYLHSTTEGLLCAFFSAIGQRKKGEKLQMNWNLVAGARGRCEIDIRNWESNGKSGQSNEVKKFLEPVDDVQAPQKPSYQQGRF